MGSATDLGCCRVKVLAGGFVLCEFFPVQAVLHNLVGKALAYTPKVMSQTHATGRFYLL